MPLALLALFVAKPKVPGVVIDTIPAKRRRYVGSPSIAILLNGDYVATHDEFGPKSTENEAGVTRVFRSDDRGASWARVATVKGAFWSTLFVHRGALYLLGTDRQYGDLVIHRSEDGGASWAAATIRDDAQYHTAPVPVVVAKGRLWRGVERRDPATGWGTTFQAGMMSAPVDADPMRAGSWTLTDFLPSQRAWNGGDMGGWLEGNAVVAPDGNVVDVLRIATKSFDEKAAIVKFDGQKAAFDDATGFVDFPGGSKKFTIRFDPKSGRYWALASTLAPGAKAKQPSDVRNTLSLVSSKDLAHWEIEDTILKNPDVKKVGFQYADWTFDGNDIVAVVRTAFPDGKGGAKSFHDANYLTFHRVKGFRERGDR